jgi:hypothetical protein
MSKALVSVSLGGVELLMDRKAAPTGSVIGELFGPAIQTIKTGLIFPHLLG